METSNSLDLLDMCDSKKLKLEAILRPKLSPFEAVTLPSPLLIFKLSPST
jgi:hypothetical protein